MPADLQPLTLAIIAVIYLLAGLVKGATGFGLPVVSVALLPWFIPIEMALAINAIVITATNIQQVRQAGAFAPGFAAAWPMMLGMGLMVPVGAYFVSGISPDALMLVLGCFVLVFVTWSFRNPSLCIPPAWAQRSGFGMGLISGIVGALTSSPGPIFVAYVHALQLARPVFITALGFIMLLFGVILGASYIAVDVLRWEHVPTGLMGIPPAMLGMWLGNRWAARLPVETFRRIVLVLLGVLAVAIIWRAVR